MPTTGWLRTTTFRRIPPASSADFMKVTWSTEHITNVDYAMFERVLWKRSSECTKARNATWPPPRPAAMQLSNPDECPFVCTALSSTPTSLTPECSNTTLSPRSSLAGSASVLCSLIYLRSAPSIPKARWRLTRPVWVGSTIRSLEGSHPRVLVLFSCYWGARPVPPG